MRKCDAGKTCPRKGLSEPAGDCPPGKFCPIGELKRSDAAQKYRNIV